MINGDFVSRFNGKNLIAGATALIASAALYGCGSDNNNRARFSSNPADRYSFDFGQDYENFYGQSVNNACLSDTGYSASKVVVTSVRDEKGKLLLNTRGEQIIDVHPASSELEDLHFVGLEDEDTAMRPADPYTRNVLESNGCDLPASPHRDGLTDAEVKILQGN